MNKKQKKNLYRIIAALVLVLILKSVSYTHLTLPTIYSV